MGNHIRINQMNINQIQIPKNNLNNNINIFRMANNIPMNIFDISQANNIVMNQMNKAGIN